MAAVQRARLRAGPGRFACTARWLPGLAPALLAFALPAAAQSSTEEIRVAVASARLGTGYAQMINLSATPDLSAASYRISGDPAADMAVLRLPYQSKAAALSPDADLYWKVSAGWLQYKQDFRLNVAPDAPGSIDSKWNAYSVGAGLLAKLRLGDGFTLEPALDLGLARLDNGAGYHDGAAELQPLFDGLLFNWHADAWLVTPSVALEWRGPVGDGEAQVRGHVARSWIGSFDETDSVQHFNEAANLYSIRADYVQPTRWNLLDRPVNAVGYVGYAGFFGANRDVLGFDGVAEVGAGIELPIASDHPERDRVRLAAAWLFGSGVRGWTVGVSLRY